MAKNASVKTWQLAVEADGKRYSRPPVDLTPPTVPQSLTADTFSSSEVDLAWGASSDGQSGVADYIVEKAAAAGGPFAQVTTSLTNSVRVGALAPSTTHYFRVTARDNAAPIPNTSAPSNVASATTSAATVIPDATLRAAGYILPTDSPYNADPTFTTDSTAGIQSAIDAAYVAHKAVWLKSGIYKISGTLRCYRFSTGASGGVQSIQHQIKGATVPSRPVLKLAASAALFDGVSPPRPMMAFMQFKPSTGSGIAAPATLTFSPYTGPGTQAGVVWNADSASNFGATFCGIDFDTNGHDSAEGLCFSVAQRSMMANCKVTATGSVSGFRQVAGRTGAACNLEVVGGQYAVNFDNANYAGLKSGAGQVIAGLKATGQTVAMVKVGDFVPCTIVGFEFTGASGAAVVVMESQNLTAYNTLNFLDGTVDTTGLAFDNTVSKALFLRNIFVTGTANIVKTGGTTYSRSGTWKYIDEYSVNDMTGTLYVSGDPGSGNGQIAHQSMIEGTVAHVLEPISATTAITSSAPTPPTDLRTRHIYDFPSIDSGPYYDAVVDYGANIAGGDARQAIQNAIDDAKNFAGHNRVFLRKGTFLIGNSLNLHAHTKLFGIGVTDDTLLSFHPSWAPVTGNPVMITTDNDTEGTAFLGFMTINRRTLPNPDCNRFSLLTWRVGRKSCTAFIEQTREFLAPANVSTNQMHLWKFMSNGGGRHYSIEGGGTNSGVDFRMIYALGTTQPLQLYGVNPELAKKNPPTSEPETNCEFNGAQNIRAYGGKREGGAPSLWVIDGTNIMWIGGGASIPMNTYRITGNSSGVLVAASYQQLADDADGNYMIQENVTGGGGTHTIIRPNGLSIYKRGSLSDAGMAL